MNEDCSLWDLTDLRTTVWLSVMWVAYDATKHIRCAGHQNPNAHKADADEDLIMRYTLALMTRSLFVAIDIFFSFF